ncbi:MAG: 50S ribosomal protein L11 methyltransferase [Desulfobulbus sp.]|jgi:ribosomal protein L11 methyltransferase
MNEPVSSSSTAGQWLKISFFIPLQAVEAAADLLAVLSGAGVEQGPDAEEGALVSGFFLLTPDALADRIRAEVAEKMTELLALYNLAPSPPTLTLLADEDWATSWQRYFKAVEIVPGLVIKPSWEIFCPEPGQQVIEMDPGMAFGTGQHASTRMALTLLFQCARDRSPSRVLDVGTGTGILAMAAALFGAGQVVALDNDAEAVRIARENVAANGLDDRIEVSAVPLADIEGRFDLITANIVHDVLVEMSSLLADLTVRGGYLALSGLLSGSQERNLAALYEDLGFEVTKQLYQEEWAALLLRRIENL